MHWWLRARIDGAALTLLAIGLIAVPILGAQELPFLRLGVGPAPYAVLLPALVSSGLIGASQKGHFLYESITERPTGRLLLGFNSAAVAVVGVVWCLVGVGSVDLGFDLMAGRNAFGYVGIGLIGLRLVGGLAASASPVVYAVVLAVLGSANAPLWSWPLYPVSSLSAVVCAMLLFVAGLCAATTNAALRSFARRGLVP